MSDPQISPVKKPKYRTANAAFIVLGSAPVCIGLQFCFWLLAVEWFDVIAPEFATKLHTLPFCDFLAAFRWTRALDLGHVAASVLWIALRVTAKRLAEAILKAQKRDQMETTTESGQ